MRLSISSLTGRARTLVAVGTVRLTSMFATVRAAAPRRIRCSGPACGSSPAERTGGSLGSGARTGSSGLSVGSFCFTAGAGLWVGAGFEAGAAFEACAAGVAFGVGA